MLERHLTRVRILFALSAVAAIVLIAFLVYLILSANLEARSGYFVKRQSSELSYLVGYKLPEETQNLSAALGLAGEPTSDVAATGTAKGVPILLYHGEGPAAGMPTAVFVEQLQALKRAGWQTITLEQFEAFMQGKTTLPAKSFLLTFDDGRRDTFYSVDPVLKDLNYTAVMFVITGFSLPDNAAHAINNFYLSKAELAYMEASGRWELESHGDEDHRLYVVPDATSTLSDASVVQDGHFLSDKFWLPAQNRIETTAEFSARVTQDLQDSKNILTQDFGAPVTAFAYPLNDYGDDSVNFPASENILTNVVPQIYKYAFYQTWPGNGDLFNYPQPGAYFVKRIEPAASWTGGDLVNYLEENAPKALPYTSGDFTDGWDTNWGSASSTQGVLQLSAISDTDGAVAFLEGGETWSNYRITANVESVVGTISLAARHGENAAPYLVCSFAADKIYLERHVGESQVTLASVPYRGSRAALSMSVVGGEATCNAGGVSVSSGAGGVGGTGGVAVEVWDPQLGSARAEVTKVSVAPL